MYDKLNIHDNYHEVVKKWFESHLEKEYIQFKDNGHIKKLTCYKDPNFDTELLFEGDTMIKSACMFPFTLAWFVLPQKAKLALKIYNALISSYNLRNQHKKHIPLELQLINNLIMAYILSIEFDDTIVSDKLRPYVICLCEGKRFGDNFYGWFFHLSEKYPRGQLSGLLACTEVMNPGDWQRAFHNFDCQKRFSNPTVTDIDFPKVGLSQAYYQNETGKLLLTLYPGNLKKSTDAPNEGHNFDTLTNKATTTFKVVNLVLEDYFYITCDGKPFYDFISNFKERSIIITTTIDNHHFVLHTKNMIEKPSTKLKRDRAYSDIAQEKFVPITILNL